MTPLALASAETRVPGFGEQRPKPRALLRGQLRLCLLDGVDSGEAQIRAEPLDLPDLGLDLPEVHGVGVQERGQVRFGHPEIGLAPDRLALEVGSQPLEVLNLFEGEAQLVPVAQHERDERTLAALSRDEMFAPAGAQVVELAGQLVQGPGQLLMGDRARVHPVRARRGHRQGEKGQKSEKRAAGTHGGLLVRRVKPARCCE
jgi:hypothetical protein